MQSYIQYHEVSRYCKCEEEVVKIKDSYFSGARQVTRWTCRKITETDMLKRKHCSATAPGEAYTSN